jgi:hypothetical protein
MSISDKLAVDVTNASEPTLCAEKDNVYLKLQSDKAQRFTIEAVHPGYIGTIVVDRWAPDFTNCDMSKDPVYPFKQRRVTLHETNDWWLVGLTFPSFWRPNQVAVRVGDRVETGLHLLQVWTWREGIADEVLVIYPADGYWRARPLPPVNLRWSAYGSSFLIGPIETVGRPLVDITGINYEPETRTFTLNFLRGGNATLRLEKLDKERIVLDVAMSQPVAGGPFAAVRSMWVTENNCDVAHVGWLEAGSQRWKQQSVMDFGGAQAEQIWAGRLAPSRHNTSAPDMAFRDFCGA